jgi:hypothetical protein
MWFLNKSCDSTSKQVDETQRINTLFFMKTCCSRFFDIDLRSKTNAYLLSTRTSSVPIVESNTKIKKLSGSRSIRKIDFPKSLPSYLVSRE